jgi:hypothetical protein
VSEAEPNLRKKTLNHNPKGLNIINMRTTLFLCLFAIACNQPTPTPTPNSQTLKNYYYPLASLKEGLVYEYVNDSTQQPDHYWFFKTVEDEAGNWFLVSTRYNSQFAQDQLVREQVFANGTVCQDYRFFTENPTTHQTDVFNAKLIQTTMFAFDLPTKPNEVHRFQIQFDLPSYDPANKENLLMNYKITRDRAFAKFDTLIYQDKKLPAAIFNNLDYMAIKDSLKGGAWSIDSSRVSEQYVQNIGLVKLTKQLPSGQISSFKLGKQYTMDEFLTIAKIK